MRNRTQLSTINDYVGVYQIQNDETFIAPGELHGMFNSPDRSMSQIAYELALTAINLFDKRVMVLSSENNLVEMGAELLMLNSKLHKLDLKDGMSKLLWNELKGFPIKFRSENLLLYYKSKMTMEYVVAKCREAIERDGLDLLIIDSINGSGKKFQRIAIGLREFCREFDLSVFLCLRDVLSKEYGALKITGG